MAAANVVDDGATREGIECFICMNVFDNGETKPKSLPCGHIFCIRCIKVRFIYSSLTQFTDVSVL